MFSIDDRDDEAPAPPIAPEVDALARFTVELDGRIEAGGLTGLSEAVALHRCIVAALDGIARTDLEQMIVRVGELSSQLRTVAEHLEALRACKAMLDRVVEPDVTPADSVSRPIR